MQYRALDLPAEHAETDEISVFSSGVVCGYFQGGGSIVLWFRYRDKTYRHSTVINCPVTAALALSGEARALRFAHPENGCGSFQWVRLFRG